MEKYYLIFLIFFEITYGIIYNPNFIGKGEFPFLLSTESAEYNYLISSNTSFNITKETGTTEKTYNNNFLYSSDFIHIFGKSYINLLCDKKSNNFYKISYVESITFDIISDYSNLFDSGDKKVFGSISIVDNMKDDEEKDLNFIIY